MTRRGRGKRTSPGRQIYFEFYPAGKFVRVTAIDAQTGAEIIITGTRDTPQSDLERVATRSLMRKLAKKKSESDTDKGGGILA